MTDRTKRPIRTALIGYGLSGRVFHAPNIAADARFSLDVIVTANPKRAAAAAQRFPQARIVPTRDEMFALADNLDLLVIATPPHTHLALAAAGIGHGLHVTVDKPFVVNSDEGEKLTAEAAAAGVVLTVFQNQQWDADFLSLRRRIAGGSFGEIQTFEARFESWSPNCRTAGAEQASTADAEGLFFDLGTRVVDQAKELFGPVVEIRPDAARRSMAAHSTVVDENYVCLQHAGGVQSRLWMGREGPRFRVLASGGNYTKWGQDGQASLTPTGVLPLVPAPQAQGERSWGRIGADGAIQGSSQARNSEPDFYRLLADSVLDGGPVPADPAGSLEVLRIMEGMHLSG